MGKVQPVRPFLQTAVCLGYGFYRCMHGKRTVGNPAPFLCIFRNRGRTGWYPLCCCRCVRPALICCSYRAVFLCCFLFQKIQHLTSCFIQCLDRQKCVVRHIQPDILCPEAASAGSAQLLFHVLTA